MRGANADQLTALIRAGVRWKRADGLIQALKELANDRRQFVSVDGILTPAADAGCPQTIVDALHRRLQILHWESRGDGAVELPLLSRVTTDRLDASDPEVLWKSVDILIGNKFQKAFLELSWPVALHVAHQIRHHTMWGEFLAAYETIVEVVERDHLQITEEIVAAKINDRYLKLHQIIYRNRPDKWTTFSCVCHLGSWYVGMPTGWVFRVGSGYLAVKKGY